MKSILIISVMMILGTSCGKNSTSGPAGNSPSKTPISSNCNLFKSSDSYSEIAAKSHRMASECGLDEAQILALLKNPGV
jgi:hypothetical protein